MTGEDLIDSMEYVDAQLVEAAEDPAPAKKRRWKPVAVIAACLAVLIGIGIIIPNRYFRLVLSAERIADVFEDENILGDEEYAPGVVVAKGQIPRLNPLPTGETALIFHRNDAKIPKNDTELQKWSEPILERMCDSLGIGVPDESANKRDYLGYAFGEGQTPLGHDNWFYIERSWEAECHSGQYELRLDGELVTIDKSQSDEEILASLESIKQKLFVIFGVEFPDAKVVGGERVYFYDEAAHPLNQVQLLPVTDYIVISFDNYENWIGDIVSEDKLINARIEYCQYRMSPSRHYQTIGNGKLISLEDAEEMLAKGYVFGKKCQECMAAQSAEGCSHYDYVSFEYVADSDRKGLNLVLPCYGFYKKTGELSDGLTRYAITYVCAIEIWGLENYFESQ